MVGVPDDEPHVSYEQRPWKPWVGLLVPSATPPPSPSADTTPPDTSITSGPGEGSTSSSESASFGFSSTEAEATFECRLDGAAFAACSSPKEYTGLADGSHTFEVRAIDAAANVDQTPAKRTWTRSTAATADPVIAAAGDIACDPASGSFNGGQGTSTNCRQRYTADGVKNINPEKVLMLGDAQYEKGYLSDFQKSYDPSWGAFKAKTLATAGTSHDSYGGGDFFSYYGLGGMPRGAYKPYSVDIGNWHIISMNSGCEDSNVGGCGTSSSQYAWLKADLEQNTKSCVLAMWHKPYWTSGYRHNNYTTTRPFMDLLHAHRADLLLTSHEHAYERLLPMRPDGTRDDATGITSFVVGTGGKSLESDWGTISRTAPLASGTPTGP